MHTTVYKKIEGAYDTHAYRYYSNGAVYLVNYGKNNKKKESVALCDSIIYCNIAVFLDPYNIPLKMQKLINDNKDKVIENQKNEAIKKKQNKIKKTIKKSSDKQLNDPYSNIKNFLCFNKDAEFFHNYNNRYNDFIKFIQDINKKLIDINKEEHKTVDDFINEIITGLLKSGKMITDLTDKEKYLFVLGIKKINKKRIEQKNNRQIDIH